MHHIDKSSYGTGKKGAAVGISVNLGLFLVKLFAGVAGRSQAMIADAFHTAGDAVTSIGVLIGFKIAEKPADEHHPYGHGRAESIAAKLVGVVIILTGSGVALSSAGILINGPRHSPGAIALVVSVVSIAVKESAYRRVIKLSRKIGSAALEADALHHRSDAFSSVVALAGIAGARAGIFYLDPLAGIVVAGIMMKMGAHVFQRAFDELMDAAPSDTLRKLIDSTVSNVPGVEEVKKIRVRKCGIDRYLEIVIGVDGERSVEDGHNITMSVKNEIKKAMSNIRDIVVHVEPAGPSDE